MKAWRKKKAIANVSLFFYYQLFISYFSPFFDFFFSLFACSGRNNNQYICFFQSFLLSVDQCFFSSFSLCIVFFLSCIPHQTIDFVQLKEMNEKKLCKKNSFMNECENWIKKLNRTGTHRTNCINETDSHSCMYNTQYWRCTFTGVVLVSNCNRSRCIFSSYGCLQFQRNFATSKRIYICTNRMVCVCVERTVMCCDVWCELRCRVVMKNENKWEYWAEDAKMKLNSTVCPSFSLVAPFFLTVCFPSYSFLSCSIELQILF